MLRKQNGYMMAGGWELTTAFGAVLLLLGITWWLAPFVRTIPEAYLIFSMKVMLPVVGLILTGIGVWGMKKGS